MEVTRDNVTRYAERYSIWHGCAVKDDFKRGPVPLYPMAAVEAQPGHCCKGSSRLAVPAQLWRKFLWRVPDGMRSTAKAADGGSQPRWTWWRALCRLQRALESLTETPHTRSSG